MILQVVGFFFPTHLKNMRAREIASWNPRFFQGWNFHPKHLKFHHLVDWPIFWNFWWGDTRYNLLTFYMKHSSLIHQPTKLMDRTVNIPPDVRPIHLLHPFGSWNSASPPPCTLLHLHLQLVCSCWRHFWYCGSSTRGTGFLQLVLPRAPGEPFGLWVQVDNGDMAHQPNSPQVFGVLSEHFEP